MAVSQLTYDRARRKYKKGDIVVKLDRNITTKAVIVDSVYMVLKATEENHETGMYLYDLLVIHTINDLIPKTEILSRKAESMLDTLPMGGTLHMVNEGNPFKPVTDLKELDLVEVYKIQDGRKEKQVEAVGIFLGRVKRRYESRREPYHYNRIVIIQSVDSSKVGDIIEVEVGKVQNYERLPTDRIVELKVKGMSKKQIAIQGATVFAQSSASVAMVVSAYYIEIDKMIGNDRRVILVDRIKEEVQSRRFSFTSLLSFSVSLLSGGATEDEVINRIKKL